MQAVGLVRGEIVMDYALSEQQQAFRETAARFARQKLAPHYQKRARQDRAFDEEQPQAPRVRTWDLPEVPAVADGDRITNRLRNPQSTGSLPRMVTYYFDFRTGDVLSQDEEGASLPDIEAAHRAAVQAIADAIQGAVLQDLPSRPFLVEVRDDLGRVLEISAVLNSKILRKRWDFSVVRLDLRAPRKKRSAGVV